MRLFLGCFFVMLCMACSNTPAMKESLVNIQLSKDSQMVVITGLDYSVIQELKKDSLQYMRSVFPVYRMPVDTEMLDDQEAQYGMYQITGNVITFKPDTAFAKHQLYVARFYGSTTNYSTANLVRSKTNLRGMNFTEVRFKF